MNRYEDWNGQRYDYDLSRNDPFRERIGDRYQFTQKKNDEEFDGDWDDCIEDS